VLKYLKVAEGFLNSNWIQKISIQYSYY